MATHIYAAGYGGAIWLIIGLVSGDLEAWDSRLYWAVGFPALMIGSAVLGWLFSEKSWRWGAWLGGGQAVMAIITALIKGSGFGLIPLSLILFMALSVPFILLSATGGVLRRKCLQEKDV
ncbi:MAG: hypothetical protein DHS20C02_02290 [Micavibrio sp.]|nr:MAG: hypothetical protein DHS20C02_02290 [Micavibrio sp.]